MVSPSARGRQAAGGRDDAAAVGRITSGLLKTVDGLARTDDPLEAEIVAS